MIAPPLKASDENAWWLLSTDDVGISGDRPIRPICAARAKCTGAVAQASEIGLDRIVLEQLRLADIEVFDRQRRHMRVGRLQVSWGRHVQNPPVKAVL
ncbi:MAG: hypothetical protein R3E48_22460 [Burkholderiaceae bacterium]